MWQYPDMLPKLYTWGPVVQKLIDGAGRINILDAFKKKSYTKNTIEYRFNDTWFSTWS